MEYPSPHTRGSSTYITLVCNFIEKTLLFTTNVNPASLSTFMTRKPNARMRQNLG